MLSLFFREISIFAVCLKALSTEVREAFVKYRNNCEIVRAQPSVLFIVYSFTFISFETSFVFQLIVITKVVTTHLGPWLPSACTISWGVLSPWLFREFSVCSRSLRNGSCCHYFCGVFCWYDKIIWPIRASSPNVLWILSFHTRPLWQTWEVKFILYLMLPLPSPSPTCCHFNFTPFSSLNHELFYQKSWLFFTVACAWFRGWPCI